LRTLLHIRVIPFRLGAVIPVIIRGWSRWRRCGCRGYLSLGLLHINIGLRGWTHNHNRRWDRVTIVIGIIVIRPGIIRAPAGSPTGSKSRAYINTYISMKMTTIGQRHPAAQQTGSYTDGQDDFFKASHIVIPVYRVEMRVTNYDWTFG
jgi:hypothetical protein